MTDQHAVILNRNRDASMILPGECLLLVEMAPALFAAFAANEAEKVAPKLTLVDCQMIGATGRVFLSGTRADAERANAHILASLRRSRGDRLRTVAPRISPPSEGARPRAPGRRDAAPPGSRCFALRRRRSCRYWWIAWMTTEPSPTPEATRFTEPERTSPTAKMPGTAVA